MTDTVTQNALGATHNCPRQTLGINWKKCIDGWTRFVVRACGRRREQGRREVRAAPSSSLLLPLSGARSGRRNFRVEKTTLGPPLHCDGAVKKRTRALKMCLSYTFNGLHYLPIQYDIKEEFKSTIVILRAISPRW